MCNKSTCTHCLFIGGVIILISSVVLLVVWPYLYFRILTKELVLSPTSNSYNMWNETPIPMYLDLFLFNFTNSAEVAANHSIKPHFEQMGPYVFREQHSKVNKTWNPNDTITFFQRRFWHFEPDMSNGSLYDEVTNINVILTVVGHALKGTPSPWMILLSHFFSGLGQNIIVTKTVRELLFDGYEDELIDMARNLSHIDLPIPINIPEIDIPYDKFGWFYARNGSEVYDGEYNMYTGASDLNKLGVLATWNGRNKTDFYGDGCNEIKGTMGELWPPNTEVDEVTIFASDLCGTLNLKQRGHIVVEGVSGSFFVGDEMALDNGWNEPSMACFCPEDRSLCPPAGGLDVSKCRLGAPAVVSFPHFYLADKTYLSLIEGLQPNRDEHEFRIVLEQNIGIPLLVRAQLQINIKIDHIPGFNIINNRVPEAYYPMLWFRQEIKLTEEYANQAKLILHLKFGVEIALYCLLSVSIIAVITAVIFIITRQLRADPESEHLVPSDNN